MFSFLSFNVILFTFLSITIIKLFIYLTFSNTTSETLARLNVDIENLPQKCRKLLYDISKHTTDLDPTAISLNQSRLIAQNLKEDYEILKMEQKIKAVEEKMARNKEFIERLRRDLAESRQGLTEMNPNPENIHEVIRQLRQKVCSYEESCHRALKKNTKLSIPEDVYPKSMMMLISQLAALKTEELDLKERADDIMFAKQCRAKLNRLVLN